MARPLQAPFHPVPQRETLLGPPPANAPRIVWLPVVARADQTVPPFPERLHGLPTIWTFTAGLLVCWLLARIIIHFRMFV